MHEEVSVNSLLLNIYGQEKKGFNLMYIFLSNSWSHCNVSEQEKQSPLFNATQNEIKALQFWVTETAIWSTWQVFTSYLIIPEC